MGRSLGGGGGFIWRPLGKKKDGEDKDDGDTHYSDKTGHKKRGESSKGGGKRKDRFLKDPDSTE